VRGDSGDDVMAIPLGLNGGVSWFPAFKASHHEFDTCDGCILTITGDRITSQSNLGHM
jgi:hypothetical protein